MSVFSRMSISVLYISDASPRLSEDNPDEPSTPRKRPRTSSTSPRTSSTPRSPKTPSCVDITVKYDFGWDQRGTGFKYNSKSGRGSLIGNETNKVLGYKVLSKFCAMCSRGHPADDHDCVKNYEGSSKGMEPVAAVDLCLDNPNLKAAGCRVTKLVGDRDSSTMAALRKESPCEIKKILDLNHNIKGVNNALWRLKTGGYSFLTTNMINYFKRCVNYAIHNSKDDVEGVRAGIMNIKDHVYGTHDNCGDWCKAKGDPAYQFHHLPGKKPLSDPEFYKELEAVLQVQADQAEQLAPAGSSLQNESFNHMCNTRCPKKQFYCGTRAIHYRVAAAVCCKNLGVDCIDTIYKKALLTPSSTRYRQSLEKSRQRKAAHQQRPEVKKKRLFRKMKENWKEVSCCASEGTTYCSGMATTMERAAEATAAVEPSWLPDSVALRPSCVPVLFDLETSGLSPFASIVQIAAKWGDNEFSVYMLPTSRFEPVAAQVTGMKVENGKLYRKKELLPTIPEKRACLEFIAFLKKCSDQVVLVGHNSKRFDAPRLFKLLSRHGLHKDFCEVVYGLVDTLPLIKQGKMRRQELLAAKYLQGTPLEPLVKGAHDALIDCKLLGGLLQHFNKDGILFDHVQTTREFLERQAVLRAMKRIVPTLQGMLKFGVSKNMIEKMAERGVTLKELREEFAKYGPRGVEVCLSVQLDRKPRVTSRKNIIDNVVDFLRSE